MHRWEITILLTALCWVGGPVLRAQESAAASKESSSLTQLVTASISSDVADAPAPEHRNARYRVVSSDTITISFPLTPEFDQVVTIEPDGFASLAGVGDVYLEGFTTEECAGAVRGAYSRILHDPLVTVELKEYSKPYFVVTGEVNRPGKYDLHGHTSATEAIAMAGGFNGAAKHSQVLLFRRANAGWYEVKVLNLKKIFQGRDILEDPTIFPGDMLFVRQNSVSRMKRFIPTPGVGAYYQVHP